MKNIILLLLLIIAISSSSCSKDILDLNSGNYYSIKTFLKSENADTDCGIEASCEGKIVKLKGIVDINNINKELRYFRLADQNDNDFNMQIDVIESINIEVFDKLTDFGSQPIIIEGVIKGFDAPTNFSCDRLFNLTLDDASKIKLL